jgi:hypothetical protein
VIPRKFEPALFGLILSGLMSLVVSGISTLKITGIGPGFVGLWTGSWLTAWLFAFPIVLLAAPVARRIVRGLLEPDM